MGALDLSADPVSLTAALVDIASESLAEQTIADRVESALRGLPHLEVLRDGNSMIARTQLGLDERVVLAGHLDTVPENNNLPARFDDDLLYGLGSCDMKGGVACALHLAATMTRPNRDLTFVFYEAEEIAAEFNGLGRLARDHRDWLAGDLAIVMEPSNASVEAGCQGTIRVEIRAAGERAHSARSWRGSNAIHSLAPALQALAEYQPRRIGIDGLEYREGLNAVAISGGVAGNVIPDAATLTVNYRFAPNRSENEALSHLREVFDGYDLAVADSAPGGMPGLSAPITQAFLTDLKLRAAPKFGWTDVSKFSRLGIPAINYGPGNPEYAHKEDEHVPIADIHAVLTALEAWLSRD